MVKMVKTTILSAVLYVCKTWSFTLREERGLMMSAYGGTAENI